MPPSFRRMGRFSAVLIVVGAILFGGWYAMRLSRPRGEGLRVSGNIEATEVNISFKIPGRVEQRRVDEGEPVRRGMIVAQLDTADLCAEVALRKAELEAASAALDELLAGSRPDEILAAKAVMEKAQATLAELKAGSRPQEIEAAKAEFTAAEVDRDRMKTELDRAADLQKRAAIAVEQYDQRFAAWRVAAQRSVAAAKRYDLVKEGPRREEIDQAQAALAQAQAQFRLVHDGPRREVKDQARARVEQAKASLQAAEIKLGYAAVTSPLDGVVLSKNAEPGEYVAPGTPIVTVADIENVWLRAYVDERDVGTDRVRLNDEAEVTTDAYPGKIYKGRVSFISSQEEFTPKIVQTNSSTASRST